MEKNLNSVAEWHAKQMLRELGIQPGMARYRMIHANLTLRIEAQLTNIKRSYENRTSTASTSD